MSKKQPGKPPLAAFQSPKGWESETPFSFQKLAKDFPDWFQSLTKRTSVESYFLPAEATATKPKALSKLHHTIYVILSAQLHHWKQSAEDSAERLKDHGLKDSISISDLTEALSEIEDGEKSDQEDPIFGGHLTVGYPWLDEIHDERTLRCALGCIRRVFHDLREDAGIPAGQKGHRTREFTFDQAMRLLKFRLRRRRPHSKRRREIAEEIWDHVMHDGNEQRRGEIRKILIEAGAACEELVGLLASERAAARG